MFEERSMPKLWWLKIECAAHDMVSMQGADSDFGIHHLTSLKRLEVRINCAGTRAWVVEAAEAAIRNAATFKAIHPMLGINRFHEDEIIEDLEQNENPLVAEGERAAGQEAGNGSI
jgi:hypothetical protein